MILVPSSQTAADKATDVRRFKIPTSHVRCPRGAHAAPLAFADTMHASEKHMRYRLSNLVSVLLLAIFCVAQSAMADPNADWPMYRGDAGRTGVYPRALPASPTLRWVRELESPAPAWPSTQNKLRFDASYEPVVMGKRLYVGSMVADRMTAYDTDTGEEVWRFYANGPIRFAPVAWENNLYFVSDDGFLYCLDATTGKQRWAVRGGPDGRMALGNGRLISTWPARGAPVLWTDENGNPTVYFAASIWPFMGTFIHAVDAETGSIIWTNSGSGSTFQMQQHSSPAFAGVAPQGYLAVNGETLFVSGGRTVPAAYNRKTGEFLYYKLASRVFDKSAGGFSTSVLGKYFISGGGMYSTADADPVAKGPLTLLGAVALMPGKNGVDVLDATPVRKEEAGKDRHGADEKRVTYTMKTLRTLTLETPLQRFFFYARDRAYGAGAGGVIGAVDLEGKRPTVTWSGKIDGEVWSMLPGDGKLFVVSVSGKIYCFDNNSGPVKTHAAPVVTAPTGPAAGGFAVLWGFGDDAMARVSALMKDHDVIAIEADPMKVASLRRKIDDGGMNGRVHVLCGEPMDLKLPPYFATRIEVANPGATGLARGSAFAASVFHALRPYGGTAVFRGEPAEIEAIRQAVDKAALPSAKAAASQTGKEFELIRDGALPGSAPWTHQYADVANTVVSRDTLVKPPLGLLWFGGPSNDDILPRHGHGPTPQVIGGRLFIEGPNALRAIDVYTGRLLWQRELPGLGRFYDNTNHQPGAGEIGSNYVTTADSLYVVHDRKCLRLDTATGKTIGEFTLPGAEGQKPPYWGYVGVYNDLLIATAMPVAIRVSKPPEDASKSKSKDDDEDKMDEKVGAGPEGISRDVAYASSSELLVVMDRNTGRVLWSRKASQVFRHNAIAVGADRIFCIDAISPMKLEALKRRGEEQAKPPVMLALDVRTGEEVWKSGAGAGGTWLGYSAENNVLISGGSPSRDRAKDESGPGMAAFHGGDGKRIWRIDAKYSGTPILYGKTIYTDGLAFNLMTGKPIRRENPITGQASDWSFARSYGCNSPIAGQYMLLFRSAAAGFFDLQSDNGTANWGGFKSGCTSNLIPADGVLVVPDYTRTCSCSYQNQSSLAMVSMPDVEVWSFQSYDDLTGRVKRVGVNLGAPGDWHSPDGTLWLDYPIVGGKGPKLTLQIEGEPRYFRKNAMEVKGPAGQVTASGVIGATSIRVGLNGEGERKYTVRLYFLEPEASAAGERVFDVALQGKSVLGAFDVFAESGGRLKGVVKEFKGVAAGNTMTVELTAGEKSKRPPVISGVEVVME